MKNFYTLVTIAILLPGPHPEIYAQSDFDPGAYRQFLENNKTLTSSELLSQHPPPTTYYSSRASLVDPGVISWLDSIDARYQLTVDEKELLANNHFMVSERLEHYSWVEAFISIYSSDLPLFISSDFVLHTLHNSYDAILQTLEWQFLEPNLKELLKGLYESYPALYSKYSSDTRFAEVLADVDLYVAVARTLLMDEEYLPRKHGAEKYHEIMAGIEAEQLLATDLFTRKERTRKLDFSQFRPRGHYTEIIWQAGGEKTLENYFRAMMWLGRIDFMMTPPPDNPWEAPWKEEEIRRMQLGAILLNELLYSSGKLDLLNKHEEIISFLVGPDDNLTPDELNGLRTRLLGSPSDLFGQATFQMFSDSLNASDDYGQKIMSNFFYVDPETEDPGQLPVSFKLLGQKFLLDSYVLSEVVYDRILHDGVKVYRGLPDPLDAMAALGNEDAIALLEDEMEEFKYAYKLSSLKYLVDAYDEGFWEQSLYNTWLASIRELNPLPSAEGLPYFMQTTAWHHKQLNTQLASWAELRHDNILYGKQSYTGATGCSFPHTFLEPYPGLYDRLEVFADNARAFFREVLSGDEFSAKDRIISYYSRYAEIMGLFEEIARKELLGIELAEAEITFLKTMINSYMISGPGVSGWYNDLFFDQMKGMSADFIVADVHTQPTDRAGNVVGHVLHVGTGRINKGVFLAPNPCNPGQLMAFTGPVSSFHYEVTDDFYRLNDEEWTEKFWWNAVDVAPRPDWVWNYLAGKKGSRKDPGRSLKGMVYQGTGTEEAVPVKKIDYLLAFPVPARDEVHLRFILNRESPVAIEVFDITGRMLQHENHGILQPAEHDIKIDLREWQKGPYLLRFSAGTVTKTKRIIKQ